MKIRRFLSLCSIVLLVSVSAKSLSQDLTLVGNKVETYINDHELPARQIDIVKAGLAGIDNTVTATTQAWYGTGLRNGTFAGFIDHYSLNTEKDAFLYSKPYMTIHLHLAAKTPAIKDIALLDQLGRARVGIETRFANTDTVRGERSVSWARAQMFFENLRQFADKRVDFMVADKDMIEQFNKLLAIEGEEPIYTSTAPMYIVEVSLAVSKSFDNAQSIINQFDKNIAKLKTDGTIDELLLNKASAKSLLNPIVYKDIIRKW